MIRVVQRLALLIIVTALALVAAEFGLRFVFRHAQTSGNARDYIAKRARQSGPAMRVNNVGFRDRDVPPKSARYRIVVVGDSFAWGQGIEEDERFSNRIERALGPGFEVFNFGQPGNNFPEHLEVLPRALAVKPDFVLLQLYINDWETRDMVRPEPRPLLPPRLEEVLEIHSILYDLLSERIQMLQQKFGFVDSYAAYMARNLEDPNLPNSRLDSKLFEEFIDRVKAAPAGVGVVLFPAPDTGTFGRAYPFRYLHERTARECAARDVPFVDLLTAYGGVTDPRTLWVNQFDAHPNARSNAMAADAILARLGPVWRRAASAATGQRAE